MNKSHKEGIVKASEDGELYSLWYTNIPSVKNIDEYIDVALEEKEKNTAMPFVVIDNKTNKIIGATRFCNTNINDKRVEIGFTWYSKSYQKSAINTNCKYLLLSHAIARLGAKQDGILRNHSKDKDGGYRDTVVFSIINHEWLIVKKSLEYKLNKKY